MDQILGDPSFDFDKATKRRTKGGKRANNPIVIASESSVDEPPPRQRTISRQPTESPVLPPPSQAKAKKSGKSRKHFGPAVEKRESTVGRVPRKTANSQKAGSEDSMRSAGGSEAVEDAEGAGGDENLGTAEGQGEAIGKEVEGSSAGQSTASHALRSALPARETRSRTRALSRTESPSRSVPLGEFERGTLAGDMDAILEDMTEGQAGASVEV